ncbi:cytochrome P450 [Coniophora puteana RWD-64-598 SS2]|uniref:Cytochrome P450 n=1 Tax=Coniophora puteana (strain RWD-64-598) TaxID=741705 RepID=R7SD47_CONPW|nr:cytochrome P450 [Coniophora puteana RWD-64-598 SS2]EIW74088.1 cytochrome P450 [Coniophora puteana RWD-64-598 SS2]
MFPAVDHKELNLLAKWLLILSPSGFTSQFSATVSSILESLPPISLNGLRPLDVAIISLGVWLLLKVARTTRRRLVATRLRGPPRANFFLGQGHVIDKSNDSSDAGPLFEAWEQEYGSVYSVPSTIGIARIVLCDPKAVMHFYQYETLRYDRSEVDKHILKTMVSYCVTLYDIQRKAMTPAFSNAAIRNVTSTFYDSAYKVRPMLVLCCSPLDSIGVAGFSHNFGTLDGKHSEVAAIFDKFATSKPSLLFKMSSLLGLIFPALMKLPTARGGLHKELNNVLGVVAQALIERVRKEKAGLTKGQDDNSVIGLLIKAESPGAELYMSEDEVLSQIKLLLVAGYETTSISLSWALAELARNKDIQDKLRDELSQFVGKDPTYEQLNNGLPYLDAVVLETLRIHSPVPDTTRLAAEDDVIPLSEPIVDASGKLCDHIVVAKGSQVTVSIHYVNGSEKFWGPDAKLFKPERWLNPDGLEARAREIQGHKHLLVFADGPRICLGKAFALSEFKAVLSTLVRNFEFDMRDAKAEVEVANGFLPRPRIVGEQKVDLPLRVTRL